MFGPAFLEDGAARTWFSFVQDEDAGEIEGVVEVGCWRWREWGVCGVRGVVVVAVAVVVVAVRGGVAVGVRMRHDEEEE